MPRFFDRASLSAEQQARWDHAITEYIHVQEANLERELAAITPAMEDEYLSSHRSDPLSGPCSLRDSIRQLHNLRSGGAGDCKSALFARLLSGKPALPAPPPTSYSYPWYSVIEDDGPFHVLVDGVTAIIPGDHVPWCSIDDLGIRINQCPWTILSRNAGAQALIEAQAALFKSAQHTGKGSIHSHYRWTPDIVDLLLMAYAARPQFIVQYRQGPRYCLQLARHTTACRRDYADHCIAAMSAQDYSRLCYCANVFDVQNLFINAHFRLQRTAPRDGMRFGQMDSDAWYLCKYPVATKRFVYQDGISAEAALTD